MQCPAPSFPTRTCPQALSSIGSVRPKAPTCPPMESRSPNGRFPQKARLNRTVNTSLMTPRNSPGYHIEQSQAAPWFHQPGGGTQYRIIGPDGKDAPVDALLESGYLKGPGK